MSNNLSDWGVIGALAATGATVLWRWIDARIREVGSVLFVPRGEYTVAQEARDRELLAMNDKLDGLAESIQQVRSDMPAVVTSAMNASLVAFEIKRREP